MAGVASASHRGWSGGLAGPIPGSYPEGTGAVSVGGGFGVAAPDLHEERSADRYGRRAAGDGTDGGPGGVAREAGCRGTADRVVGPAGPRGGRQIVLREGNAHGRAGEGHRRDGFRRTWSCRKGTSTDAGSSRLRPATRRGRGLTRSRSAGSDRTDLRPGHAPSPRAGARRTAAGPLNLGNYASPSGRRPRAGRQWWSAECSPEPGSWRRPPGSGRLRAVAVAFPPVARSGPGTALGVLSGELGPSWST